MSPSQEEPYIRWTSTTPQWNRAALRKERAVQRMPLATRPPTTEVEGRPGKEDEESGAGFYNHLPNSTIMGHGPNTACPGEKATCSGPL